MGCCTTLGKVLLIILNLLFLILSLAFIAVGVILKFFVNVVAKYVLGALGSLSAGDKSDFNIPDLSDLGELPFVGDLGIALIVAGGVLFVISFLACCGACCQNRPMLILFALIMSVLVIAQGVVGGLFLKEGSVLHKAIQNNLGDKVKDEYDEDGSDVFTVAITLMQYQLDCCGIRGQSDHNVTALPATCCKKAIIDGSDSTKKQDCVDHTAPPSDYNTQGCYSKLTDAVFDNLTYAAVALGLLLFLQVMEIVFAILVVLQVNNENSKVGPY